VLAGSAGGAREMILETACRHIGALRHRVTASMRETVATEREDVGKASTQLPKLP